MNICLPASIAAARNFWDVEPDSKFKFSILGLLLSVIFSATLGCTATGRNLQKSLDRSAAKRSFLSWNLRALVSEPRETAQSRAFKIASLSNRELYQLIQTRPAPDLATISGKWNGINKGIGSAMIGLTQDVKVLEGSECVRGYNILVKQVAIKDLPCRGWQPERDPKTCKPKTMGNFIAIAPTCCGKLGNTVKLDYTIAENPWYDPSRFLIDEIVAIDDDLLLGRATAKVGAMHIPVAYFVLSRAPQCKCPQCKGYDVSNETISTESNSSPQTVTHDPSSDESSVNFKERASLKTRLQRDDDYRPDDEVSASDKPIVLDASEPLLIDQ